MAEAPELLFNLEWLNHNSVRSYPFADDATRYDIARTVRIPDNFILGLYFPIHAGLNVRAENFYISKIAIFTNGLNLTLSVKLADDSSLDVASAIVPRTTHREYDAYSLPGIGDFSDSIGKIVIGNLNNVDAMPTGLYLFAYEDGKLDTDCVRPIIRGLSSITVRNGDDISSRIVGDVELVAGTNMRLTPVIISGQDPQIRFDAISGEGLNDDCVCDTDNIVPDCIRTIDMVPADNDGNFTLLGNDCLEVLEIQNGLQLNDKCSAPCCGCTDLEAITRQVERLGSHQQTLELFVNRLATRSEQMFENILGSKLNDQGCVTC